MSSLEPQLKRLKDLPRGEWMDAADVCDFCGTRHKVRIDWVDEKGDIGDVTVSERHGPGCPFGLEGEEEHSDIAGWEYAGHTLRIVGRDWPILSVRYNVGLCLNCGRLVVGVPLILFLGKGRGGELDFCFGCALELGIMDRLVAPRG